MSCCYVIAGNHGLVKIGMSTNPEARLATLQTGSPHKLRLAYVLATNIDAAQIEGEVHRILDKNRCAGEWFDVTPQRAEEVVNSVCDSFGLTPVASGTNREMHYVARASATPRMEYYDWVWWAFKNFLKWSVVAFVAYVTWVIVTAQ
jgi:Meiotically up-regulated gene 113